MNSFLERRHERKLLAAGRLYRRGRGYVIWVHGLLFFGGSIFLLCNAFDYFLDNGAPFRLTDLIRIGSYLAVSAIGGLFYGQRVWRNLDRMLGLDADPTSDPVQ